MDSGTSWSHDIELELTFGHVAELEEEHTNALTEEDTENEEAFEIILNESSEQQNNDIEMEQITELVDGVNIQGEDIPCEEDDIDAQEKSNCDTDSEEEAGNTDEDAEEEEQIDEEKEEEERDNVGEEEVEAVKIAEASPKEECEASEEENEANVSKEEVSDPEDEDEKCSEEDEKGSEEGEDEEEKGGEEGEWVSFEVPQPDDDIEEFKVQYSESVNRKNSAGSAGILIFFTLFPTLLHSTTINCNTSHPLPSLLALPSSPASSLSPSSFIAILS